MKKCNRCRFARAACRNCRNKARRTPEAKRKRREWRRHPRQQTRISWEAMIARCTRKTHPKYENYGGRGIAICVEWRNSFDAFIRDMGLRPSGMSIDRIDPDGNYEKSNCRWATPTEQVWNRRCMRG